MTKLDSWPTEKDDSILNNHHADVEIEPEPAADLCEDSSDSPYLNIRHEYGDFQDLFDLDFLQTTNLGVILPNSVSPELPVYPSHCTWELFGDGYSEYGSSDYTPSDAFDIYNAALVLQSHPPASPSPLSHLHTRLLCRQHTSPRTRTKLIWRRLPETALYSSPWEPPYWGTDVEALWEPDRSLRAWPFPECQYTMGSMTAAARWFADRRDVDRSYDEEPFQANDGSEGWSATGPAAHLDDPIT